MNFEFLTATRIVFGAGKLKEIGPIARAFGKRVLIVTGRSPHRSQELNHLLGEQQLPHWSFGINGEPDIDTVEHGLALARSQACEVVIGFGGGSVIDTGKAIAALLTNGGDPIDYLEVIGNGKPITQRAAPYIAIPTTAGTGAEVTRNAVLSAPEHKTKVSLRSPLMLPAVALVDPELTRGLPPGITAATGLDALTQLIEPFISSNANPMTDAICREGMRRAARSLRRAYEDNDPGAREDMAMVSVFGGLALANAGLGAVHGFAGPLGGMYNAPHGALCAALLPHVFEINERVVRDAGNSALLHRFQEVRQIVGDVGNFVAVFGIPPLRQYNIPRDDFPSIIAKAGKASSMKTNPVKLTDDQLFEVLDRAW